MAILFENEYQKIIESRYSYDTNNTEVTLRCYSSKQDRDNEKALKNNVELFKFNVSNYINLLATDITNEINVIQPIETITNGDSFLALHPALKSKIEEFEAIRSEALILQDRLLKSEIEYNSLKYKDVWVKLGLKQEMLKRVNIVGEKIVTFQNIKTHDLETLYKEIKNKIVGLVVDC